MVEGKERSYLCVRVQTRARERRVERTGPSEYKVCVISPPSKGRATREVVEALASYFAIPPSRVKIVKGETSRRKWILIEGQGRRIPSHGSDKNSR
ncbi:MAG: DUF167 domain-containing protein [Candidatus Aminicenantales bacterium]